MNHEKKIIFLILLIVTLFIVPQTDAQINTPKYCVTADAEPNKCFQFPQDYTDEQCTDFGGIVVEDTSNYPNNDPCGAVCCCDGDNSIGEHPIAYCIEELEGRAETFGNCTAICAGNIPDEYSIQASITHTDGTPAQGNYYLLHSQNDEVKLQGTYTQGNAIIKTTPATYKLKVTSTKQINDEEYMCENETTIELYEDITISLTLNECALETTQPEEPEPEPCQPVWIYEYENEADACGEILGVIDINECEDTAPASMTNNIGQIVPCIESPFDTYCGNGQLDLHVGEQCDISSNGIPIFAPGIETCEDFNFNTGYLTCQQCLVSTAQCSNCPTTQDLCDSTMCDCEICDAAPACIIGQTIQCSQNSALNLQVTKLLQTPKALKLTWTAPEQCLEDATVNIYRAMCDAGETNCEVSFSNPLHQLETNHQSQPPQYIDSNFPHQERSYCYKIQLLAENNIILNSTEVCTSLSDDACLGRDEGEQFCHENKWMQCLQGTISPVEDCAANNERCIHPMNENPRCVASDMCDSCNGPFGMFGHVMYKDNAFEKLGLTCKDIEDEYICFREDYSQTKTTQGQFNHCADISTCYDYRTKGSCEDNRCSIDVGDGCEWTPFMGEELGLGVCKPTNEEFENCNLCDENLLLGGACTRELCELYGDCHFNEEPNPTGYAVNRNYCMSVNEVGCETYNTQAECEGEPATKLNINIEYNQESFFPISGTHQIIRSSEDLYNRGICVWTGTDCIRDADFTTSYGAEDSDCNQRNTKDCLLDFIPPKTNITIRGQQIESGEYYSTTQLLSNSLAIVKSEIATTKFSIAKKSELQSQGIQYKYPEMNFRDFAYYILNNIHNKSNSIEQYTISFYSKDLAQNLEEVQHLDINLLTQLSININHELTSKYYDGPRMVLSNVTITTTSPQENYVCRGRLTNIEGQIAGEITKPAINGETIWEYHLLEDGEYIFLITCEDEHEQKTQKRYEFSIYEDNIITNPKPINRALSQSPTEISIETVSQAECYFIGEGPINTGQTTSTATSIQLPSGRYLHRLNANTNLDGVYIYRPRCIFQDQDIGHYEGNNGDLIFFGIDKNAPTLTVYDVKLSTPQNPIEYDSTVFPEEQLHLQFVCEDYEQELEYNDFNFNFGCDEMSYELAYNQGGQTNINQTGTMQSGAKLIFNAPYAYTIITLRVQTLDNGGNMRTYQIPLRLRTLIHGIPTITICNPDTQICI
jgi:hypothetical protein